MKLLFKGKETEVKISKLTGGLKRELMSIIKKRPVDKYQKEIYDAMKDAEGIEDQSKMMLNLLKSEKLTANDIIKKATGDYIDDNFDIVIMNDYEFVRAIIDKTQIKDAELLEVLNGEIEYYKEFWDAQDYEEIEKEIGFFRKKLGIVVG